MARPESVRGIFTQVAPHYDLMNRLMSAGQDTRWRREVIRRAGLAPGERLLDIGAGTGDLAAEALRQQPGCRVLAADFTPAMMRAGRRRHAGFAWSTADALCLPFADAAFDVVVSGFLLRNVADLQRALAEQYRVLKRGGRLVALDTTRPRRSLLLPLVRLHLRGVIPLLGRVVARQGEAYRYLQTSTEGFIRAEELVARLAAVGFHEVGYRVLMAGTVAIHWGKK